MRSGIDGEFYVGYTQNLVLRFKTHSAGRSFATRPRRPFAIVYAEACLSQGDALRRERYLKTSQGRRLLKHRLRLYLQSSEV